MYDEHIDKIEELRKHYQEGLQTCQEIIDIFKRFLHELDEAIHNMNKQQRGE